MSSQSLVIAFHLEQLLEGLDEEAFHGLLELDHDVLPELGEIFHASTNTQVRVFLLNVMWQHRQPSVIPILAEALNDDESEVWQEAMDGLVSFSSEESLEALRAATNRKFTNPDEAKLFTSWLKEAIAQVEEGVPHSTS